MTAEMGGVGRGAAATDVVARAARAMWDTGAMLVVGKSLRRLAGLVVSA